MNAIIKDLKVKKQVIVDPKLYRMMKAKMFLLGITFSQWLDEKMQKELENDK